MALCRSHRRKKGRELPIYSPFPLAPIPNFPQAGERVSSYPATSTMNRARSEHQESPGTGKKSCVYGAAFFVAHFPGRNQTFFLAALA